MLLELFFFANMNVSPIVLSHNKKERVKARTPFGGSSHPTTKIAFTLIREKKNPFSGIREWEGGKLLLPCCYAGPALFNLYITPQEKLT